MYLMHRMHGMYGREKVGKVSSIEKARKKAEVKAEVKVQVYQCMTPDCGRQDWRMHDDFAMVCNGCDCPSSGVWFIPVNNKCTVLRTPRKKFMRSVGRDGYVCGYCSNITFHMYEDGKITCFRCKEECFIRFYFPQEG